MLLDQVPIAEVHPAPWNVRTGHAVDAIAESIRVNGFRDPIEAWRATGEIVCGEGRYLAARELGMETVPVVWHDFDSLASAKRYAIANNRLTDRSEFDLPALQAQLEELDSLAGTGFDEFDLPTEDGWGQAAGNVPEGDRAPFQQMTFTLTDAQAERVKEALSAAKEACDFADTGNENSNGNALAALAEAYLA